jgi:HlyD family secretion protein
MKQGAIGAGMVALAMAGCGGPAGEAPMSGYAEAELVYLAPSAGGLLQTLAVRRGEQVARGQALYSLEAAAEALGSASAQARGERAQAQVANLGKGRRPLELQALDQQLNQARANLASSTATLERNQGLVAQGYLAPLRLEELQAARDRDVARVKELQAQRNYAETAARVDEIAAAAADARAAQAELGLARWQQAQKSRIAPTDALVYDVYYRVGEWVPAGAPVLALLAPGAVKVRFFVPETQLARARVGQAVALSCDGCSGALTARIDYISPQAEFTPPVIYSNVSRSKLVFMVEATPTDAAALKPGQPLDVRFGSVP